MMSGATERRPRLRRAVLVVSCLVLLLAVVVLGWRVVTRDSSPQQPPRETAPGTLVSATPITSALPGGLRGWRISYLTTDVHGAVVKATGTVTAAPGNSTKARPVLAVAHGTTGVAAACAPSRGAVPFVGPAALRLLAEGWVAVSPDYVGLGSSGRHGYLVGTEEAHAVLDGVRAARSLLSTSKRAVVWGHSQGGHAALWTGSIAKSYAPDVDLLGVAATAPATDLPALVASPVQTPLLKVVESYLASSWSAVYGGVGWVAAANAPLVDQIARLCVPTAQRAIFGLAAQIRGPVFQATAVEGELGDLLDENVPRGPFEVPVFVGQGSQDAAVPVQLQRRWVVEQCREGASLDYREYPGLGHTTVIAATSPLTPDLTAWIRGRLAGDPVRDSCASLPGLQP